jgi:hypothetical protein
VCVSIKRGRERREEGEREREGERWKERKRKGEREYLQRKNYFYVFLVFCKTHLYYL